MTRGIVALFRTYTGTLYLKSGSTVGDHERQLLTFTSMPIDYNARAQDQSQLLRRQEFRPCIRRRRTRSQGGFQEIYNVSCRTKPYSKTD